MENLTVKIKELKKKKNAVILAHFYQVPEIQDIADFVGDSLALSQQAANTNADIIVFCGVHFMAETAKVLSPDKKVLLPDLNAGCSLADSCQPEDFGKFLENYPNHTVVTYINCSAEIKAMTDIVCTSSNALKIIESIPEDQPIVFAPDKNLGRYLVEQSGRNMVLWDGSCVVHEAFSFDKLLALAKEHPDAIIIAHPESEEHILKLAKYIGSTSGMLNFVKEHPDKKFIVATETGILHRMQQLAPNSVLIPAPVKDDYTCACSECAYMKMNTLQKLYDCLDKEVPEITLEESIISKALRPIQRMLELSK